MERALDHASSLVSRPETVWGRLLDRSLQYADRAVPGGLTLRKAGLAGLLIAAVAAVVVVLVSGPPAVSEVRVSLEASTIQIERTTQATALLLDAGGDSLAGRSVIWSTSNAGVAQISSTGEVKGIAAGTATITATSDVEAGQMLITVISPPVATVSLSPAETVVKVGDSILLEASLEDDRRGVLADREVAWSSDAPDVAPVDSSGVVTGVRPGSAVVSAASEGQVGRALVNVVPRPVASVTVSPESLAVIEGEGTQLTVRLVDDLGDALGDREVSWRSDNRDVASVGPSGFVTGSMPGSATVSATSEGQTGHAFVTVVQRPVESVSVSPDGAVALAGESVQLRAGLRDGRGDPVEGREVVWESNNPGVASVDSSGMVIGITQGSATVSAASGGRIGKAVVTVRPRPVASVSVEPDRAIIEVEKLLLLEAVLKDDLGNLLAGREITWRSSEAGVASVSSSGLVIGKIPGSVSVSATSEGRVGLATITVVAGSVASVSVARQEAGGLETAVVAVGDSIALEANLVDDEGNPLTGRKITWDSDNPAVATVDSSGRVSGVEPGSATISAASEGRSGLVVVTVVPRPVASMSVTPDRAVVEVGGNIMLVAVLEDELGITLTGREVRWSSDSPQVASVNSSGRVVGLRPDSAIIRAESQGQVGQALVTVVTRAVASVSVSPPEAVVEAEKSIVLAARLDDGLGNQLTGREVLWSSLSPEIASVDFSGKVIGIKPGSATINAASEGQIGQAIVTVVLIPVASVSVSPVESLLVVAASLRLVANLADEFGNPITGREVAWTSNNPAVATVDPSGAVTGVTPGSAIVSAASEGQLGLALVTVLLRPVALVLVSPAEAAVLEGDSMPLEAALRDEFFNLLTDRVVTWASSNPSVATVDSTGEVAGIASGSATITATSEGKAGQAVITVAPRPVASVSVDPDRAVVGLGGSLVLAAALEDDLGNTLTGREVTWVSDNFGVATVSTDGVVSGLSFGCVGISASSEGKRFTATIAVAQPREVPYASLLVIFNLDLDPETVDVTDFVVGGSMPVTVFSGEEPNELVLVMAFILSFPELPEVSIVGDVRDPGGKHARISCVVPL